MFIIPSLILGTASAAATMRMTRTMMLEVLRQDYIRTAWSKGLKERAVVIRHAADFDRIDIPEAERGVWRAEEEFISAIRGNEVVTYTDFVHGVRYMEFTEAVHRSIREQRTVAVPFQ